ncbi:hypothetical protein MRB53_003088, partial [Persea americana]
MRKFRKMKMEKTGDGLAALEMPERQRQRRSREMKTEKREDGFGNAGEMKKCRRCDYPVRDEKGQGPTICDLDGGGIIYWSKLAQVVVLEEREWLCFLQNNPKYPLHIKHRLFGEQDGEVKGHSAKNAAVEIIPLTYNKGKKPVQSQTEASTFGGEEEVDVQQDPTSLAQGRAKRNIRPPQRFGYDEDEVHFALITGSGDPTILQEAMKSSEKKSWM